MKAVNAAADLLTDPDEVPARRLGVDEHRYEPWMTTFVDAEGGRVSGVVDGRDSAGVGAWLAARSAHWCEGIERGGIEVLAIDPSAAFGRALCE